MEITNRGDYIKYKYFNELDKPDDFNIYLKESNYINDNNHHINNINLENIKFNLKLLDDIKFIETLVTGMDEKFIKQNISYNEYEDFYDFFNLREEFFEYSKEINISSTDLENSLNCYIDLCNYLSEFFPQFKDKIGIIKKDIINVNTEIEKKSNIVLPSKNKDCKYTLPNAWFITPDGYLYNTGGEDGHKEGNLIYPFHYIIKNALYKNKNVSEINNLKQIKRIIKRGFVTQSEFKYYANLINELPTIDTSEVDIEKVKYKKVLEMSEKNYLNINKEDLPTPKRSYQRNIINLVIGHLNAEQALYNSFYKLNDSNNKSENMKMIEEFTRSSIPDVLVRYSGFHKVESVINKTITTSKIDQIDDFKTYLNNGWTLSLIPGLIYDKEQDKIVGMNFNSYMIEKYLNKKVDEYNGKILIKR